MSMVMQQRGMILSGMFTVYPGCSASSPHFMSSVSDEPIPGHLSSDVGEEDEKGRAKAGACV